MTHSPFDWSKLIADMKDESFGIPFDVVFQIVENGQVHEVKAHKAIVGLVSIAFRTMFSTKVGDETSKEDLHLTLLLCYKLQGHFEAAGHI